MLVAAIIRPPRDAFEPDELGPQRFRYRGCQFVREDGEVKNGRGLVVRYSHWKPTTEDRRQPRIPCVVYLHGNSSSRVGCRENLSTVLSEGCSMLAIDFAGSGRSEGEYVTLGWWERDDVQAVVTALRRDPSVSAVALWGRSMGAATAILHSHRDPSIAGLVLDSPFADLRLLIDEIVADQKRVTGVSVPNWVLAILVRTIRSAVWKRTRCDIARLKPAADVNKAFIPALFAHGRDDTFIRPHHSRMIHDAYAGDKNIVMFSGGHNRKDRQLSTPSKMQPLDRAPIRKQGTLTKLGGSDGGHKNWKERYFVLSDHLAYYNNQQAFQRGEKANIIRLNAYFVSAVENSKNFEFAVNAYPKSLVARARSAAEMEEWIQALMEPLEQLRRPAVDLRKEQLEADQTLEAAAGGAVAGGGGAAAAAEEESKEAAAAAGAD